jgi:hypothetical protein
VGRSSRAAFVAVVQTAEVSDGDDATSLGDRTARPVVGTSPIGPLAV